MVEPAEQTIQRYYDALRSGDPLHPFFADEGPVVKVGVGERLIGAEAVAEGLQDQTRTTDGWEVESRDLNVGEGDGVAWFGDDVFMGWTDAERRVRFEFETRWTGALVERDGEWRFVEMHVSTPDET